MRWWRSFRGKDADTLGPRRRKAERIPLAAPLRAKCSSWSKFADLVSGDISAGGLYVPTDQKAEMGDAVDLEIALPGGRSLTVKGKVVAIVTPEQAARAGRSPGLGVKLEPLEGEAKARYAELLEAARGAQPQPPPADMAQFTTGPMPVVSPPSPREAPPPLPPPARAPGPADLIVGIDLGTTYTSVAAVQGKKVTILKSASGELSTPSVVSFPERGKWIVGAAARALLPTDPRHTVTSPKRFLGRRFRDRDIEPYLAQAAYDTVEGPDGQIVVKMWDDEYAITQICSYVLRDVLETAEARLGQRVKKAVITVPVSFDESRTTALRRAAQLAQLEVAALIDEPSAAALANRYTPGFGGIVGIYDFGGGTFDFSLVDVGGGDFQVLATAGDTWLGGDDFDAALAAVVADRIEARYKVNLRHQAVEWQRLLHACERVKRSLSTATKAPLQVPGLLRTAEGMMDLDINVDRGAFEKVTYPVVERSLQTCDEAMELVDVKPTQLSAIFLSGGTTYIPIVRKALEKRYQVPVRTGVPPEHAVCLGAAIHAAQLSARVATTL